jgi:hypothetical protein
MNYFRASWLSSYKGKIETLRLKRDPFKCGLGIYEDADGVRWDVHGMQNSDAGRTVMARRIDDAPQYYSTASDGHSGGSHRWIPYYVEVM